MENRAQQLTPGSLFKIGDKTYEFEGFNKESSSERAELVARIDPDVPSSDGVLHKIFTPAELEAHAVRIGFFGELFPYSHFVKEKQAWQTVLGGEAEVPFPPENLIDTLARAKEKGLDSFVPHYLPRAKVRADGVSVDEAVHPYPDGWHVLGDNFWFKILGAELPHHSMELFGEWAVIDTTRRSRRTQDINDLMYSNDPLKSLIQKLEILGDISPWDNSGSRFGIPLQDLNVHIFPLIRRTLETKGEVRLPRPVEYNVLGNLFHPDFSQNGTTEWFLDTAVNGLTRKTVLVGGDSEGFEGQGLRIVRERRLPGVPANYVGFRPMIVF